MNKKEILKGLSSLLEKDEKLIKCTEKIKELEKEREKLFYQIKGGVRKYLSNNSDKNIVKGIEFADISANKCYGIENYGQYKIYGKKSTDVIAILETMYPDIISLNRNEVIDFISKRYQTTRDQIIRYIENFNKLDLLKDNEIKTYLFHFISINKFSMFIKEVARTTWFDKDSEAGNSVALAKMVDGEKEEKYYYVYGGIACNYYFSIEWGTFSNNCIEELYGAYIKFDNIVDMHNYLKKIFNVKYLKDISWDRSTLHFYNNEELKFTSEGLMVKEKDGDEWKKYSL